MNFNLFFLLDPLLTNPTVMHNKAKRKAIWKPLWWDIIKLRHPDSLECVEWLFVSFWLPIPRPPDMNRWENLKQVSSWLNYYWVWTRLLVLITLYFFHTTTVPLLPPAGSLLHPQSYAAGSWWLTLSFFLWCSLSLDCVPFVLFCQIPLLT